MSRLLALLLAHLRLAIEGDDDPAADPPAADPVAAADDGAETTLDDLTPEAEPRVATQAAPAETPRERGLRERAERAERFAEDANRRTAPPPAAGPFEDPQDRAEREQIEAARRAGQNETAIQWMQWQHQNNVRLRQSERTSQQAVRASQDAADRADFQALLSDKPSLKPYAAAIEKHMRDNANTPGMGFVPRSVVARLVIGDAVMNAKAKPKAAAKPQTPGSPPAGRVDRGRSPGAGARSDVSGRGARTPESVALRKRLENVNI